MTSNNKVSQEEKKDVLYETLTQCNSAYLKPDPPVSLDLRPIDPSKHISKKPWCSANPYDEIPPLKPLLKHKLENKPRKLRKEE
ncbi:hypothetical protein G6F46_009633 [Rhizopus delemar]|uniref:Uncharacterized protein n=2 Tax=Rhizopus TaxID=4842 RepID=A0A9P6Z5C9_9FUNG|nr:hypothetical protein G6F43_007195 [Rhizopus delemar]KAG1540779.1 hypothetical protein G6F51_008317 [Rhizopus arrhizus]KAG1443826.1 hypothetical protein G6F55_012540 [Rhizopus delemar]KAG1495822.1 hypothetical protein G6F54_006914 [Rhizopus delemar]KAG1505356.1 hypothetical protein G6F52_012094 [Rhizopus delemar]